MNKLNLVRTPKKKYMPKTMAIHDGFEGVGIDDGGKVSIQMSSSDPSYYYTLYTTIQDMEEVLKEVKSLRPEKKEIVSINIKSEMMEEIRNNGLDKFIYSLDLEDMLRDEAKNQGSLESQKRVERLLRAVEKFNEGSKQ